MEILGRRELKVVMLLESVLNYFAELELLEIPLNRKEAHLCLSAQQNNKHATFTT